MITSTFRFSRESLALVFHGGVVLHVPDSGVLTRERGFWGSIFQQVESCQIFSEFILFGTSLKHFG